MVFISLCKRSVETNSNQQETFVCKISRCNIVWNVWFPMSQDLCNKWRTHPFVCRFISKEANLWLSLFVKGLLFRLFELTDSSKRQVQVSIVKRLSAQVWSITFQLDSIYKPIKNMCCEILDSSHHFKSFCNCANGWLPNNLPVLTGKAFVLFGINQKASKCMFCSIP